MKKLTLPKPATDLWTPARDIIHEIPTPEETPHPIRPHIAGGSALAARWNHRASTDIDIVFPGRVSLTDLIENDPWNILQRLGGTPDVVDHRQIVIDFPNGAIDLAAIDPRPSLGQADTLVDGRIETVLSNARSSGESSSGPTTSTPGTSSTSPSPPGKTLPPSPPP